MSIESARAYIQRMRDDAAFRQELNAFDGDEARAMAFLQAQGYNFTTDDFKSARDAIYTELGIEDPM